MKHIIGVIMLACFVLASLWLLTHAMVEVLGWKGVIVFWLGVAGVIMWLGLAFYLVS